MATSKIQGNGNGEASSSLEKIVASGTLNTAFLVKVNGTVNLYFDLRNLTSVLGNAEIIQIPEGFRPRLGIRTIGVVTLEGTSEVNARAPVTISTAGKVKLDFSSSRTVSDVMLSVSYGAY